MTNALDVLRDAAAAGVHVAVSGGSLILDAPAAPSAEILDAIKRHKPDIIALLNLPRNGDAAPPYVKVSDLMRGEASTALPAGAVAPASATPVHVWRAGFARLHPSHPIGAPTQQAWETFLRDCKAFLASKWADKAMQLGWNAVQLFGCHRDRPDLIYWHGALWSLHGGTILAMTEATMSFKTIRGVRQSLRRLDHPRDFVFVVPAWEAA